MTSPFKSNPPARPFSFNSENLEKAKAVISHYPEGKQASAVVPLLDLAQRQLGNWLSPAAMDYVAELLDISAVRVGEIASFYTMFNLEPVGIYHIKVCRTSPCWLMGGDEITKAIRDRLKINIGETTPDRKFTLSEVECLGACANGPVIQINDDYYEDLTPESVIRIIDDLSVGNKPEAGSQKGRCGSCSCHCRDKAGEHA